MQINTMLTFNTKRINTISIIIPMLILIHHRIRLMTHFKNLAYTPSINCLKPPHANNKNKLKIQPDHNIIYQEPPIQLAMG